MNKSAIVAAVLIAIIVSATYIGSGVAAPPATITLGLGEHYYPYWSPDGIIDVVYCGAYDKEYYTVAMIFQNSACFSVQFKLGYEVHVYGRAYIVSAVDDLSVTFTRLD